MSHVSLFERFAAHRDLQSDPALEGDDTLPTPPITEKVKAQLATLSDKLFQSKTNVQDTSFHDEDECNKLTTNLTRDERRKAPWITSSYSKDKWVALHQELIDFVRYIRPTEAETGVRKHIVDTVSKICKKLWPESVTQAFGSLKTKLLLPMSDVDLCISNVTAPVNEALADLADEIKAAKLCEHVAPELILNTRVPIVRYRDALTSFSIDISINSEEGLANTEIIREMLRAYPASYPLIIFLKYFLQRRRMNETYYGGLGSYATALLVVSFLQHHPYNLLPPSQRRRVTLGMLLVDLLRYYGSYCNFINVGIRIAKGGSLIKKTDDLNRGPLIRDPCNEDNNAASATRYFSSICRSFESGFVFLMSEEAPPELPDVELNENKIPMKTSKGVTRKRSSKYLLYTVDSVD